MASIGCCSVSQNQWEGYFTNILFALHCTVYLNRSFGHFYFQRCFVTFSQSARDAKQIRFTVASSVFKQSNFMNSSLIQLACSASTCAIKKKSAMGYVTCTTYKMLERTKIYYVKVKKKCQGIKGERLRGATQLLRCLRSRSQDATPRFVAVPQRVRSSQRFRSTLSCTGTRILLLYA